MVGRFRCFSSRCSLQASSGAPSQLGLVWDKLHEGGVEMGRGLCRGGDWVGVGLGWDVDCAVVVCEDAGDRDDVLGDDVGDDDCDVCDDGESVRGS